MPVCGSKRSVNTPTATASLPSKASAASKATASPCPKPPGNSNDAWGCGDEVTDGVESRELREESKVYEEIRGLNRSPEDLSRVSRVLQLPAMLAIGVNLPGTEVPG